MSGELPDNDPLPEESEACFCPHCNRRECLDHAECARMLLLVGAFGAVERVIRKSTEGART